MKMIDTLLKYHQHKDVCDEYYRLAEKLTNSFYILSNSTDHTTDTIDLLKETQKCLTLIHKNREFFHSIEGVEQVTHFEKLLYSVEEFFIEALEEDE